MALTTDSIHTLIGACDINIDIMNVARTVVRVWGEGG